MPLAPTKNGRSKHPGPCAEVLSIDVILARLAAVARAEGDGATAEFAERLKADGLEDRPADVPRGV